MSVDTFRMALSAGFRTAEGTATYPSFDLSSLIDTAGVEMFFLSSGDPICAKELENDDALILLSEIFNVVSIPASGRLSIVAPTFHRAAVTDAQRIADMAVSCDTVSLRVF